MKAYSNIFNCILNIYLVGLIKGDSSIIIYDKNTKDKKYYSKILIVFNLADKPFIIKLSYELKVKIICKPNAGHVFLQILAKNEVLKIINLINSYICTSKIEVLEQFVKLKIMIIIL